MNRRFDDDPLPDPLTVAVELVKPDPDHTSRGLVTSAPSTQLPAPRVLPPFVLKILQTLTKRR